MRKLGPLVLLVTVSLLATQAFFRPGFIPTHDGEYHIVRQWQFSKNLAEGNIFPIWAPDLNSGYGVPIFEFFYPLPGYIGHIFVLLDFSFIDSLKLILASGVIVSAFTFYLWSRCFFKKFPSVVGSIAYVIAPYHTVDTSIRGSVGEVWALAIVPFVLFSLTKLLKTPSHKRYLPIFSLSAMLLIISHNVVGVLFYALSFVYGLLLCFMYKHSYRRLLIPFISSLLLSAFFWLPLIFESQFVTGLNINNYREHFPAFFQLIFPSWGAGMSVAGLSDQMSFQIGLVHIAGAAIALYMAIRNKQVLILSLFIISVICSFLMLESSNILWEIVSPLKVMQFPWRLLSVVILLSSFFISYISDQSIKVLWAILIFSLVLYLPYTQPVIYEPREDSRFISNPEWLRGTTTWGNTFQIKGFSRPVRIPDSEFIIVEGLGQIVEEQRNSTSSIAITQGDEAIVVEVKRAYFPGWSASIDGNDLPILKSHNGAIRVAVPNGKHSIMVMFGRSPVRIVSFWISVVTMIGLLCLSIYSMYENRTKHVSP